MASKAEKKRKVAGRGGARAGRVVRAPQSTAGPGATEASLLPDGQEPEPESGKEDSELEPEKSEKPTELGTSLMDMKPFFLSRTMLTGLADATWTGEHDMVLEHFVQDPAVPALTIFIDPVFGLKLELGMPVQTQNQIVYFIRQAPVPITPENFEETVQYGTVRGAYIPALLRLLSGVYVPQIFMNKSWPESIRNHFVSHLHRFGLSDRSAEA